MARVKVDHLGWREWAKLPRLGVRRIKAKIDSGARTSALHAKDIHYFERDGMEMVRFKIQPIQRSVEPEVEAEAEVIERRWVKSSSGHLTKRPVVLTTIQMGVHRWSIELTLIDRDLLGFRMLIGRKAVRGRFLIDPARSFLMGKPKKRLKKKTSEGKLK